MKKSKSVYNADKENSIFAVKLRGLFDETKRTQQELIDFIKIKTGKNLTRQTVSAWTHGALPDIKTVPIIAEFFKVSTDYLLTETEIRPIDVDLAAVCEYTGLSPKSIQNLKYIKTQGLRADLLLENELLINIIDRLEEIEQLEIEKRYYELVINPIANGDEFYDHLLLNDVKMCKFQCDRIIKENQKYKQECEKCSRAELDKDYIFRLLQEALDKSLSRFGPTFELCPDWLSEKYNDRSDLEEFKITKTFAAIIANIKDNANCSPYFLEQYKTVRAHLVKELKDIEMTLKHYEDEWNDGKLTNHDEDDAAEFIGRAKAKMTAIITFLEKYDDNFDLKEGADNNG